MAKSKTTKKKATKAYVRKTDKPESGKTYTHAIYNMVKGREFGTVPLYLMPGILEVRMNSMKNKNHIQIVMTNEVDPLTFAKDANSKHKFYKLDLISGLRRKYVPLPSETVAVTTSKPTEYDFDDSEEVDL